MLRMFPNGLIGKDDRNDYPVDVGSIPTWELVKLRAL